MMASLMRALAYLYWIVLTSKSHLLKLISCCLGISSPLKRLGFRGFVVKPHMLVKLSWNILHNLYRMISVSSIAILSIVIQICIFGHNSFQSSYLLITMINQSICNTLGNPFYLLFNLLNRASGSFNFFPVTSKLGDGLGSSLPCSISCNLSLATTSQVIITS